MTMLLAWAAFPAILLLVCVGAGLLVERLNGGQIPTMLIAPIGAATLIVAGQFATASDSTAELATPLCVGLAIVGLAAGRLRGRGDLDPYAIAAAAGVFVVFGAPVILSGDATFTGYIKLDDTATWFAMTDRVMEHGRSLDGLAPSTYEATLFFNLERGYPVGAFLPLGVGRDLVGQDVAWIFQPYLAFFAAMLTLVLASMLARAVESARLRALAVFVAAQPALLVGYAAWGGIKELVAAPLIALLAALAPTLLHNDAVRRGLPIALCLAALISVMSFAGAVIWVIPALAPLALATVRFRGDRAPLRQWGVLLGLVVVLTAPWIFGAGVLPPTSSPLTSDTAQGNLLEPLNPLQVFGVWPVGDFRVTPDPAALATLLVGVVALAGLAGLWFAWRAHAWGIVVYAATGIFGATAISVVGSPWVAGKALAIASPALLFLAAAAIVIAWDQRRALAALAGLLVFGGVLWSNILAYGEVTLAPRDRHAELEEIGERIAGEGPTLMTEYEPYGARHFLRDADPEGASELRRSLVPLLDGGVVAKGTFAELDRFDPQGILAYRTLVLRHSPTESRPPAPFELVEEGRYYEVWQQPVPGATQVAAHTALGDERGPTGRVGCRRVRELASQAGPDGRVVAASVPEPVFEPMAAWSFPPTWNPVHADARGIIPAEGAATSRLTVPRAGSYSVWLGGAWRGKAIVTIDDEQVGAVRHELSYPGHYLELGSVALTAGPHHVELTYAPGGWRPGTHGPPFTVGPVALVAADDQPELISVRSHRAESLCGRKLDWIEAVTPGG